MWATWLRELAAGIESALRRPIASRLFAAVEFDAEHGRVYPTGALALAPMSELRVLVTGVLIDAGVPPPRAQSVMDAVWFKPDPVRLARPLANLPRLFMSLRARDVLIALATSDDRAPTEATVEALGLTSLVKALICADDRLPIKPAADMVLHLCGALDIPVVQTAVVGDSISDMQMARSAGAGLAVGVLSGLCTHAMLAPIADVVIPSVADLVAV